MKPRKVSLRMSGVTAKFRNGCLPSISPICYHDTVPDIIRSQESRYIYIYIYIYMKMWLYSFELKAFEPLYV